MPVYKTRPQAEAYGYCTGILLLDYQGPFVPGDVGNADTYDYPVLFKVVEGATYPRVFTGDPELEPAIIKAAQELEAQGVKAISSDCGFFLNYQDVIAKAVNIPVCASSLLQVPFVASFLGKSKSIGVITADSTALSNHMIAKTGLDNDRKLVIKGMQEQPCFDKQIMQEGDELVTEDIERETVEVALEMQRENPDLGAIVLECSMLPPYSKAVQEATGLPVYDFITMIDYFQRGTHQKAYDTPRHYY
ncbi:MAG: aspartate/glutamate racemase family protein [Proteobacteria bacterium]|nr:aspartate/glutamate racemase family protein [Pseudomonadota bacterium]